MKNSQDLFINYYNDDMSSQDIEDLKELLKTEEGSYEFVRFTAESHLIVELLEKHQFKTKKVSKKTVWVKVAVAAVLILSTVMTVNFYGQKSSSGRQNSALVAEIEASEERIFSMADGSNVHMSAGSSLKIISDDEIRVDEGLYKFDVVDRSNKTPLLIHLNHGTLDIVGTSFSITNEAGGSTVGVKEGKVRFRHAGDEILLKQGQYAVAEPGKKLKTQVLPEGQSLILYLDGSLAEKGIFRDLSKSGQNGKFFHEVAQAKDRNGAYMNMNGIGHVRLKSFDVPDVFSLSMWVKLNSFDTRYQALIAKGDSSWRLTTYEKTGYLHFAITGMEPLFINSKRKLQLARWHHVAAVYDGEFMTLYLDGKEEVRQKVAGTLQRNTFPMEVGGNSEAHLRNLQGAADEVRVYESALSRAAVEGLFHLGRTPLK